MIVDRRLLTPCRRRDPDEWFVDNPSSGLAQRLCHGCPALTPCGEYALQLEVHGIWGGTTQQRRRSLQREQGITPASVVSRPLRPRIAPRAVALLGESEELMQAGATLAEAAQQLGVSVGLLKSARARARRLFAATGTTLT